MRDQARAGVEFLAPSLGPSCAGGRPRPRLGTPPAVFPSGALQRDLKTRGSSPSVTDAERLLVQSGDRVSAARRWLGSTDFLSSSMTVRRLRLTACCPVCRWVQSNRLSGSAGSPVLLLRRRVQAPQRQGGTDTWECARGATLFLRHRSVSMSTARWRTRGASCGTARGQKVHAPVAAGSLTSPASPTPGRIWLRPPWSGRLQTCIAWSRAAVGASAGAGSPLINWTSKACQRLGLSEV